VKAAVYHGNGQPVAIEDVRVKDPGHGEVRVALKAAGLDASSDEKWMATELDLLGILVDVLKSLKGTGGPV